MKFKNKIALITGASRGLGKNVALRMANHGADIILTYRQQNEAADAVVKEIRTRHQREAVALQLDVGKITSYRPFFKQKALAVMKDGGCVVAFLCSEDARWINGQRLEASGGIFL